MLLLHFRRGKSAFIIHLGGTLAAFIFFGKCGGRSPRQLADSAVVCARSRSIGADFGWCSKLRNPAAGDSDDYYIDCDRSTRRGGNARSLWNVGGNSPTFGAVTLDWSRCGFCWDMANGAVKVAGKLSARRLPNPAWCDPFARNCTTSTRRGRAASRGRPTATGAEPEAHKPLDYSIIT